jgi:ketosteroid isomerase-like protein
MSQESIDLAYRTYDAVNRRDLDGLLALMDDDVEAVSRLVRVEGDFHGHDGVRRWWESVFSVWPDYSIEVLEMLHFEDLAIAAIRTRGHAARSGMEMPETVWHVTRLRSGKCAWWRTFATRAEALKAVGLSDPDPHADS